MIQTSREQIENAESKRQQLLQQQREAELAATRSQLVQGNSEAIGLASDLDELKARESDRGIILTIDDIVFASDSVRLQAGGERTIARIAQYLNDFPEWQLLIEGFTDSTGSEQYDRELSARRATSVARALIDNDVSPMRLETRGLGEQYPVAPNDTEAGRQKNRRVEVIVVKAGRVPVSPR